MLRTDPPAVERRRHAREGWRTYAPIAFVIAALAALALLPLASERHARPLHEQIRGVAEPGRSHLTDIHVALALEGSALHDFVETRDSLFVARYRAALGRERAAHRALATLATRMGSEVQRRYEKVRGLEREWHGHVERFLAADTSLRVRRDPLQEDLYEDLLIATGELDEAITASVRESRSEILRAERIERWLSGTLVLVALVAAGVVARLGRRVRAFAREAESRREALEQAVEARARLMRGVTHDLKNPLGAIDGHAQLLEEEILGPLAPRQQHSVANIRRLASSMLALITDLLDLARAESGRLTVTLGPLPIGALVREVAEEHAAAASTTGHAFAVTIADDLPTIDTDPARVRQVLGNLLSNAAKYTPRGGRIEIRAVLRPRDGDGRRPRVAVDVIDTGPGIPREQAAAIFEEFSRLEMHAAKPGAGLGLSIARRVAGLLGGDLSLQSAPGEGSTFTLWLPVERADAARPPDDGG